jgi:predicted CXXCH cytochrome family protein
MKKLLIMALVVGALFVLTASVALAYGGPHQTGQFAATTDACAGCHRAHTAAGPRLLITKTSTELCITCHGSTGTGANTNVQDGVYLASRNITSTTSTVNNANLLGGGFVTYKGAPTTSAHSVNGTDNMAWGYSAAVTSTNRGQTAALTSKGAPAYMTCTSCHAAHGSANYRIIQTSINAITVTVPLVDEGAAKDYGKEHWGSGMSQVCASCHTAYYKTASGQGSTLDGSTYTHRIDRTTSKAAVLQTTGWLSGGVTYTLPFANAAPPGSTTVADNLIVCETCHLSHGTSAQMTALASGGPSHDSALLRLDNRGVCEVCHQK